MATATTTTVKTKNGTNSDFYADDVVKRFNRRYALIVFFVLLLLFSSYNITLYCVSLSYSTDDQLLVVDLKKIGTQMYILGAQAQQLSQLPLAQRTLEQNLFLLGFDEQFSDLELQFDDVKGKNDLLWRYALGSNLTNLLLCCIPLAFLFYYRNHAHVRNRGLFFLIHLTFGVIGYHIAIVCFAAYVFLQFDNLNKTERENEVQEEVIFLFTTFFLYTFFASIICRMRIVHCCFNSKDVNNRLTKYSYFQILPFIFCLYFIPNIPTILKIANVFHGRTTILYQLPSMIVIIGIVIYLTIQSRKISQRFSDFYINSVIMTVSFITVFGLMIAQYVDVYNAGVAYGYFYLFHIIIAIYVYYPVCGIIYIITKERSHSSKGGSNSMRTAKTHPTSNSHLPNSMVDESSAQAQSTCALKGESKIDELNTIVCCDEE